ncbi:MAG: DUF4041 domain-containing protein [Chloroflexi bacterium]|nr:DUF4041 domain-containing protein [Chloroflexota bacterium]
MELGIVILVASVLVLALLLACGLLLYLLLDYRSQSIRALNAFNKLRDSFKDIVDRDTEIAKRNQQITELQTKQNGIQSEYAQATQALQKLQREIALSEETLDLQSFGVYKPHFDFATSESYKVRLQRANDDQKRLITEERAAVCDKPWTVDGSRREGERMTKQYMKLMLRAFNGECDATILKVRWNNVVAMEERIRKAFEAINKLGATYAIRITDEYLGLKLDELRLTYEYQEKLYQEKEEQRRIQEQIREEEKAQREIERAKQDAEEEEKRYQAALERARAEMEKAQGAAVGQLKERIQTLEQQLKVAQEMKQRAISQAQLTKSGHVYIISNVGSFGENVLKIGMTRRLEPLERVKELGDASVPFDFDVHAMIYSDDAPALENHLQEYFKYRQVNLVNNRREFFNISIAEIEEYARKHGIKATITRIAEAKEYRETIALKAQNKTNTATPPIVRFPGVLHSAN